MSTEKKRTRFPANTSGPFSLALRERFGFETPPSFRTLEACKFFQWSKKLQDRDLSKPGIHYLWLNDMEWYQPKELRTFEFAPYHKPGFVPFAQSGGGDYWCWYPRMAVGENVPILFCPHDCRDADLYAPDFAAALYRHALEYAAQDEEDVKSRRANLKRWAIDLADIWRPEWQQRIAHAADHPINWVQYESVIAEEFGNRWKGHFQVRWMKS